MRRRNKKQRRFILIWAFVMIIILTISTSYILINDFILKPAKASVISVCYVDGEEYVNENYGYEVAGQVSIGDGVNTIPYDGEGELNLTIEDLTLSLDSDNEVSNMILKHEICHVNQILNGQIPSCADTDAMYKMELECYTAQYLPDFIYNKIYDTNLENIKRKEI